MRSPLPLSGARIRIRVLVIALLVTVALSLSRRTDFFQDRIELPLYDRIALGFGPWDAGHDEITLATIRELDGWPWSDERLADFMEAVLRGGPSCVVVDLIRDEFSPGNDAGSPGARRLIRLAETETRIVWVRGVPGGPGDFPPPAAVGGLGIDDQRMSVGLAGFPRDGDGMVRRGLIAVNEGEWYSAPYLAAFRHRLVQGGADPGTILTRMESLARVEAGSGAYAEGVGGGSQFLLKPAPGFDTRFPAHPAGQVASWDDGKLREAFGGKIVLLGTDNPDLAQDEKQVPGNPDLRGLKLIAATTAQLLRELEGREEPVGWLPDPVEDGFIALCAVLSALLVWKLPLPAHFGAAISGLAGACVAVGAAAILINRGLWFPGGAPAVASILSAAGTQALLLSLERKRGNSLYVLLEKSLGPQVANRLWLHNESLLAGRSTPPEMFEGTALFADLKGYTAVTESFRRAADRDGFLRWLNTYIEACVPAVTDSGGFIQQFAGDGIFVVFGFPASGDHAARALGCADRIARSVRKLNATRPDGDPAYSARVGIYTGEILCGVVGNSAQMQFSFLGSTINKAARLESLRKDQHDIDHDPVRILFSDATRCAAGTAADPCRAFHPEPIRIDPNLAPEIVWKRECVLQDVLDHASQ